MGFLPFFGQVIMHDGSGYGEQVHLNLGAHLSS
jgi:hypothetical protein